MNEPSNAPMLTPTPGVAGWLPVWTKAVTKPSEQTFVEITERPEATSRTAFLWVFIAGTVSALITGILGMIVSAMGFRQAFPIPGMEQFQNFGGGGGAGFGSLVTAICGAPIVGLFSTLFFAIGVALIQWVAKLFGGAGTYDKMAYAFAAISVPFSLVTSLFSGLSAIPYLGICTGLLSFGLGIYALVLNIMATKGVNRFGWGAAVGSVLLPALVIGFVCACLVIGLLALLGPMIGNVFSSINQSLTP